MLAVGAVPPDKLAKAIDMPTLALLLGLMIVVGSLRLSRFFRLVNAWMVTRAHHPLQLFAAVIHTAAPATPYPAVSLQLLPIRFQSGLRHDMEKAPRRALIRY
jgi:di/tricarboxylate transporter